MKPVLILLWFCALLVAADLREDWRSVFCGEGVSCYEVLGLNETTTLEEVKKSYKALALELHPDRVKADQKEEAGEKFKHVVTAYEILSDPEKRKIYDDVTALKKRMWVPKEDPMVVFIFCLVGLVGIVYYYELAAFWRKRKMLLGYSAVQRRIRAKFKAEGKVVRTKNNVIEEEIDDELLTQIVKDLKLRVQGGWTGEKPHILDILKKAPFVPIKFATYAVWSIKWVVKYTILGQEYTQEDKVFLTRQKLDYSEYDWNQLKDKEKEDFMQQELWLSKKTNRKKGGGLKVKSG